MPMQRGQEVVHRVSSVQRRTGLNLEAQTFGHAPLVDTEVMAHPYLELGPEYDHEVGCALCTRIGTRPGWERAAWCCPFESCPGGPDDVCTAVKALEIRRAGGQQVQLAPVKHGTIRRYNRGCRCTECLAAAEAVGA